MPTLLNLPSFPPSGFDSTDTLTKLICAVCLSPNSSDYSVDWGELVPPCQLGASPQTSDSKKGQSSQRDDFPFNLFRADNGRCFQKALPNH
ncbi:hypothetical protein E2C01_015968 [Portunus trituberculatus]|uniref:Uncharacterized protein n=1 Tax=Portunus trituberculatus TaxID=210409 RepID=A0A5B7DNB7_PORTR|nr:hypothetical protein [Portunus trituberculatus]